MRKFLLAGLLALPFLALQPGKTFAGCCGSGCGSTPTWNFGFGMRIGFHHWCFCEKAPINPCMPGKCHKQKSCAPQPCGGFNPNMGGHCGDPSCSYGAGAPWYMAWPYTAHFQSPAPTGYPFWPAPQRMGPGMGGMGGCYGQAYPGYGYPGIDANVQPVGYYPQAQVPSYWYGQ